MGVDVESPFLGIASAVSILTIAANKNIEAMDEVW
jgi:hypothetical protein